MTHTSLWVKLVNLAPIKNNKPTALSPVHKVHTHLSLFDTGTIYIYDITLQPVKVTRQQSQPQPSSFQKPPPRPSAWRALWGQEAWGVGVGACLYLVRLLSTLLCLSSFCTLLSFLLQSEHLPQAFPLLQLRPGKRAAEVEYFCQMERDRFQCTLHENQRLFYFWQTVQKTLYT